MITVSICEDRLELSNHELIKVVNCIEPINRNRILATIGRIITKDNMSVLVTSTRAVLNGLEDALTITSWEEIVGYTRQVTDEDGVLQWGPEYTFTPATYTIEHKSWIEGEDEWIEDIEYELITPESYPKQDPIMETIPPVLAMQELFDKVYVRTPNEDGVLPWRVYSSPGQPTGHLLR